ncbi:MAG TPA: MFS transporter [Mycobacteriales bacterium]|jgi:EmrB/QacA subfamily drug resistance transporter|nr:MFS transporter [Mycobacteriales bacterium]
MTATADVARAQPAAPKRGHHPGMALAVITGAQLLIVLDATIVNIALPHIQTALKFSDTGLSWVLNAYTLTFGGLLLLGGRIGDILGRRRVFAAGILLFIFSSLLGGLAQSSGWLLAARALQGVGGAIASPTALALITSNFSEGKERNRAFGVFAAVSGAGSAVGLLLGGLLTEWISWRWVLFVNVPIGLLLVATIPLFLAESDRHPGRFDIGGALTSTAGMTSLVYGFIHASDKGWSNSVTVGAFIAAVVLLASFVAIETRHEQPLVPLRLFANRDRTFTYAIMFAFMGGMMGMFFFLTQFVQNVLGYSPIKAGVAFLPIALIIGVSAQISSRFLLKTGPKLFMVLGALMSTGGLAWLAQLSASSGYLSGLLGPMLVFGFGMGFLFVPVTMTAVAGVRTEDSGAASAMLNVMQQVGGSLGLSILVTVFATASKHEQSSQIKGFLAKATPEQRQAFAAGKLKPPDSVVHAVLAHGISVAFSVAIIFAGVGFLLSLVGRNVTPKSDEAAPVVAG